DEFAMGSSCERSIAGPTRNPLDLTRSPGGSSGGAAASVAAGEAAFALGTDTGGSARQPAAFCGLVSMKPTYGTVSRYGMVELASSLEQICPITRTVRDNALVLSAICGRDRRDMTTVDTSSLRLPLEPVELNGLKVGVFADFSGFCESGVADCVSRSIGLIGKLGAVVDEAALPSPDLARDIYLVTMAAEASSNLARYDGIKYGFGGADATSARSEGFGGEVRRRIIAGSYALSSVYRGDYYRRVKAAARELCERVEKIFSIYDMILMPTVGTTAFPLGSFDDSPTNLYNSDRFSVYANLTGCPAITIPCGGVDGLPVGLTLMGRKGSEEMLYGAALTLETELADFNGTEVKACV
ncbi:MAG: Asp-tRNA(Asn)/Glu-tRNA(Gln) amidotransferase subunit GatA, partial [Ruminococcaceae bacterium]|nr:Asp-tRNA(Asn)/Glu-tRNA(Gln) amidotransferase subunit GatA [Oscillospiraceae bacterium]